MRRRVLALAVLTWASGAGAEGARASEWDGPRRTSRVESGVDATVIGLRADLGAMGLSADGAPETT